MAVSAVSAGDIFTLIANGDATTRASIQSFTGLSRSTVTDRLDMLFGAGLIREGDNRQASGGRPSKKLLVNSDHHVAVAADVGETHTRVAITDVENRVLAEYVGPIQVSAGAVPVLQWIADKAMELLKNPNFSARRVLGVGLSLPAPVDFAAGQVVEPSVMTGWDGVDIEAEFRRFLDIPVFVENDVNARGFGEYLLGWSSYEHVLYVKAGTGIGSAIITNGQLYRGAQGAAGDLGHIRIDPVHGPLCRCGAVGCVEAQAAGWALVRDAHNLGLDVENVDGFIELAKFNSPEAVHLLREAGRLLGRAIAYTVNMLNPSLVIVGGKLVSAGDHLALGIRESIYQYSLPLATRELKVVTAMGDDRCGTIGVSRLVTQKLLTGDAVDELLRQTPDLLS